MPRYLSKYYFWVGLGGCFWIKLVLELVDSVNWLHSPIWVIIIQSIEDLNRAKWRKKEELCSSCLIADLAHWSTLAFCAPGSSDWNLYEHLPWLSGLWIQTKSHHKLSVVFSLQVADRGLLSLHNWVSQVLITNLFICPIGSVFIQEPPMGFHSSCTISHFYHTSTSVKIPVASHHLYQLTCLKNIFLPVLNYSSSLWLWNSISLLFCFAFP